MENFMENFAGIFMGNRLLQKGGPLGWTRFLGLSLLPANLHARRPAGQSAPPYPRALILASSSPRSRHEIPRAEFRLHLLREISLDLSPPAVADGW